jgi:DNA mismatch repair protein MutS2
VEFDEKTLTPTYRLIVGVAGASSGIEIARRMRVPAEVLTHASALLDPAHVQASDYLKRLKALVDEQEALRTALEEERQATADKYATLDLEFARREAERRNEFESEVARMIREFTAESARMIDTLKDRVTAARLKKDAEARAVELRKLGGARLRKQAAPVADGGGSSEPASALNTRASSSPLSAKEDVSVPGNELSATLGDINERDRVRITTLNQEGVVESITGEEYSVLVGSLRFRARRRELQLVKPASPESKLAAALPRGVSANFDVDESFAPEINVIGTRVDEATDRVDKFLDEAFLAGAESVRIVHGHGKGALRKAIAELLTGHSHVERFNPAPSNQGGTGATVVALRK